MIKNRKNIVITSMSIIIVILSAILYVKPTPIEIRGRRICNNFIGGYVPNEETAIQIAKVVYKSHTNLEFNDNDFKVTYYKKHKIWNVYLIEYTEDNKEISSLDYKGIFIDKNYGTIVCNLINTTP